MARNIFTGFQFVPKKPKKRVATPHGKQLSKLVHCVCKRVDDDFVAVVLITNSKMRANKQELPFTENSYNLTNRLTVFTKKLDKHGKPTCICRSESTAKYSPGLPDYYTPFCNNYIYSGYIVRKDGKYWFDMHECVGAYSNHLDLANEKIVLYENR